MTNRVGVDINRAVTDAYYQHLLPFVCGLGPRKAQVLVKKIAAMVCIFCDLCLYYHLISYVLGWYLDQPRPVHPKWIVDHEDLLERRRIPPYLSRV